MQDMAQQATKHHMSKNNSVPSVPPHDTDCLVRVPNNRIGTRTNDIPLKILVG